MILLCFSYNVVTNVQDVWHRHKTHRAAICGGQVYPGQPPYQQFLLHIRCYLLSVWIMCLILFKSDWRYGGHLCLHVHCPPLFHLTPSQFKNCSVIHKYMFENLYSWHGKFRKAWFLWPVWIVVLSIMQYEETQWIEKVEDDHLLPSEQWMMQFDSANTSRLALILPTHQDSLTHSVEPRHLVVIVIKLKLLIHSGEPWERSEASKTK